MNEERAAGKPEAASDNPIVFCNDAFTFTTGYAEAEILGSHCRFLQGPEPDQSMSPGATN